MHTSIWHKNEEKMLKIAINAEMGKPLYNMVTDEGDTDKTQQAITLHVRVEHTMSIRCS